MDFAPQDALTSLQSGFGAVWALAITYSFSVIGAVVLIVIGYVVAGLIERAIYTGLSQFHGFDETLRRFLSKTARYAIMVLIVVMVLGQFGVQTASIVAALGAIGLAIGLALQGTLQNIAAGIMLLVLRPFRIGESIKVGSVAGVVEEIGLFATRLRDVDGTYILAPNSKLWNEPVRNSTRNHARRNDVPVNISYDDDVDLAQKTLLANATGDKRVKAKPAPIAFVDALNETSIAMVLRYWTSDTDFLKAKIDLTKLAHTTLNAKGIGFPKPAADPRPADAEDDGGSAGPPRAPSQPLQQ